MATKDISDEQICRVFARNTNFDQLSDAVLMAETGQPEKVVYRAMERAYSRGLIEFGVSLRTGWLTEKGKKLIGL